MNDDRRVQPTEDEWPHERIEIEFAIPVYLQERDYLELDQLIDRIVDRPVNQLKDGIHWLASQGSKPKWSRQDCIMLRKKPDPDAPDEGEPTFDDSVFHLETAARGYVSEEERRRYEEKATSAEHGVTIDTSVTECSVTELLAKLKEYARAITEKLGEADPGNPEPITNNAPAAATAAPQPWPRREGMRQSLTGVLVRLGPMLKRAGDPLNYQHVLDQLQINLKELATRFYAGDVSAVDEFLQLYDLDQLRAADPHG